MESNEIVYKQAEYAVGRLFANRNGYQYIKKNIRRLLCDGKVTSVDISNCQPTLLDQLVKKYAHYSCETINKYVMNREKILEDVSKVYNVPKSQSKDLFIRLINGGSYEKWFDDNHLVNARPTEFVYKFKDDCQHVLRNIAPTCFNDFKNFQEIAKQSGSQTENREGRALALYVMDEERKVMGHIYEYFTNELGLKPCALIHDEWLVDGCLVDKINIKAMSDYIKQKTGFTLDFKCEIVQPTTEDKEWFESHKQFVVNHPTTIMVQTKKQEDDLYTIMKSDFERENFKLVDMSEYGTWKKGFLIVRKRKDFKEAHQELGWLKKDVKKDEVKRVSFVERWFLDGNKRAYDKYDFLPPSMICPLDVFNTWDGFPIEKVDVEAMDCERILDLIRVLSNNDDATYKYVMDWLAQIIQEPGRKSGTMLVFKSKQGAGKGTLLEIFKRMMGAYVGETSTPQRDVFGTHANAHVGKLICSLDEVRASDTVKFLGQMKNLITSTSTMYNEKCMKAVEITHFCRFIFTTNASIPINMEDGESDRRNVLIECDNKYCKDAGFWKKYYEEVVNNIGVIKGFFNLLKDRDISQVDWMDFPKTELRKDIIQASLHPIIFWFDHYIQQDMVKEVDTISSAGLHKMYEIYCETSNIKLRFPNPTSFAIHLKDNIQIWDDSASDTPPKEYAGIRKRRSKSARYYEIDRKVAFEWLKMKEYTTHDRLNDPISYDF